MVPAQISAARVGTDGWIVSAAGELDLAAAPALQSELERATAERARGVIVDLAGASFIDSTVLGVLLAARARARGDGSTLVLVTDDPRVLRVFEITGLDRRFTIAPTLPDALRVAVSAPVAAVS